MKCQYKPRTSFWAENLHNNEILLHQRSETYSPIDVGGDSPGRQRPVCMSLFGKVYFGAKIAEPISLYPYFVDPNNSSCLKYTKTFRASYAHLIPHTI